MQKREHAINITPDWVYTAAINDGIAVNCYYASHPEMMLGTMAFDRSMYGNDNKTTLNPIEGANLNEQLTTAIDNLKANIIEAVQDNQNDIIGIPASVDVKNHTYTIYRDENIGEERIYYRNNSIMSEVTGLSSKQEEIIRSAIVLRAATHKIIDAQNKNCSDDELIALQGKLSSLYDGFVNKHGYINSRNVARVLADDSDYYLLCSLEKQDSNDDTKYVKTAIFTKRTIKPNIEITSASTSDDALKYSLNFKGHVDVEYMAELTSKSKDTLLDDLKGVIYQNPSKWNDDPYIGWETADEYLSGNVRQKLAAAQIYAKKNPERFGINIQALEQVQPVRIEASDIQAEIGAPWANGREGDNYYQKFMYEIFQTPIYLKDDSYHSNKSIALYFRKHDASWHITNKGAVSGSVIASEKYGTTRMSAYEILE